MSLRLYLDHHVPSAVAEGLRRRGIDVLTCTEDGTTRWGDERLLARATELDRILYSQDDDLLEIAHRWMAEGREFAGLAYAHQHRITLGEAVRDLELLALAGSPEDLRNHVEFLPYS